MVFTIEMQEANARLEGTDYECSVAQRITAGKLAMMKRLQLPTLKEAGVLHVE